MYAVIKTGGKQYRVSPGDVLVVEKLPGESGGEVAFDQVLLLGEGAEVTVGAPLVDGALVKATLVETRKGEKVKVFKKIRRQGYRRTRGHRQFESVLRVTSIAGAGMTAEWDGEVDLTPLAVLNARARNLKTLAESLMAQSPLLPVVEPAAEAKPARARKSAPETEAPETEAPEMAAPAAEAASEEAAAPAPAEAPAKPARARKASAEAEAPAAETTIEKAPAKPRAKKAAAPEGGEA